jgi:hypothetical protein
MVDFPTVIVYFSTKEEERYGNMKILCTPSEHKAIVKALSAVYRRVTVKYSCYGTKFSTHPVRAPTLSCRDYVVQDLLLQHSPGSYTRSTDGMFYN